MSSLTKKVKTERYTTKVNGRVMKNDRPKNTHIPTYPIKDEKDIKKIYRYLELQIAYSKSTFEEFIAYRNYMLFMLGINTALRAEDLLQLKVKGVIKGRIDTTENKTKKDQHFMLNKKLFEEIKKYIEKFDLRLDDYLFASRKSGDDGFTKPITRQASHKIMKTIAEVVGINYSFGLHSLRKTFGYHYIKRNLNSADAWLTLSKMYNHSSPATTMMYICWDDKDYKAREEFFLDNESTIKRNKRKK